VLRRSVELGVNHIDTAQYYGPDVANELIHEALHPYPDDLVLVSKVGGAREPGGGWIPAQRPEQLRQGVEENLRSLAVERLDVVNLRLMGEQDEALEPGPGVPLEEQLAMMVELSEEGKIGGIGLSSVTVEQVRAGMAYTEIACIQNQMSLLHEAEPMLELCHNEGIPFVPFFPLGSAFPGMPKVTEQPAVREIADRLGATPAQIGLAWLLARSPCVLLIPGTSSLAHLEENQAVLGVELDAEAMAQLNGIRG
jgi:aryl-alcohol dehydrogenase-like predicted oxidoreductase